MLHFRLSIKYGTNSTLEKYLDIIACLCTNNGSCDFQHTTSITPHYQIASCNCPPQFDGTYHSLVHSFGSHAFSSLFISSGDLCELTYSGCLSPSACTINWNNQTTCVPLSSHEQLQQNRSYYCNGTCLNGYSSSDGYTCEGTRLFHI